MFHKQKEETERKSKQFYDTKKWEKINARKRSAAMLAKWLSEPENKEVSNFIYLLSLDSIILLYVYMYVCIQNSNAQSTGAVEYAITTLNCI